MTKFRQFINNLKVSGTLRNFALQAETTEGYINTQLMKPYKTPRKRLWNKLIDASNGDLTQGDMVEHFMMSKETSCQ